VVTYLGAIVRDVMIVVVPLSTVDDERRAKAMLARCRRQLGREVVLVAPSRRARVVYHGRADLASSVLNVPLDRVRWMPVVVE
jgi:hypothetical protein